MAINVSFNGATIYLPGAYSKETIDLGGGFPLSPTGLIALFGEADAGAPGNQIPSIANNVFTPDQMPQIQAQYGSGNLVDACNFLFAPGADGAIPGGAQAIYIYKTNQSTRAELPVGPTEGAFLVNTTAAWSSGSYTITPTSMLGLAVGQLITDVTTPSSISAGTWITAVGVSTITISAPTTASSTVDQIRSWNPYGLVQAQQWGVTGNRISFSVAATTNVATSQPAAILTLNNYNAQLVESATVGGNIVINATNTASGSTVTVTSTALLLFNGVNTTSLLLAGYNSVLDLINDINLVPNWTATIGTTADPRLPVSVLDQVTSVSATAGAMIKMDAYEVQQFFLASQIANLVNPATTGLPSALTQTLLQGGSLGGTPTSEIVNALAQFQKIRVNSVVPLFSRNATADIADNLTDPSSTYTIAGVNQAVKTHCSLMASTKEKSERQGYCSIKDTYANCKAAAMTLAFQRIQLVIQDVLQSSASGVIKWYQPWAGACLLAGARGGSPVGNPMTFKYFNMSGIRQTAQPMSTPAQNIVIGFDPATQYDDAIQTGLTFWQAPQTGGFRLAVDNTTYGKDANWVYNRGNVLYAADVLAFDFRSQMENIYIGLKNTVTASEISSTAGSILTTYLAQGITVSTADAKNGYKQLVVQINGNTVNISVVVKLVEGIDFILEDITLQRASQTA